MSVCPCPCVSTCCTVNYYNEQLRLGVKVRNGFGLMLRLGWCLAGVYYINTSPQKDRSARVCVCLVLHFSTACLHRKQT